MGTTTQLPGRETDDVFIERRGKNVLWQRSMYCSCYKAETGQPDFGCPLCLGLGYIYDTATTVKMLMTGVKQDKSYSIVAAWELGTCRATFKASVTVGFKDRIMFQGVMLTFTELLTRKQRTALGSKDLLKFGKVTNIIKVIQRDPTLKTLITYRESIDYRLVTDTSNSYIEWLAGGNKPADNERYSILYEHLPEFIVWDVPQVRTDSEYYQFAKFSILRRKDMIENAPA